MDMASVGLRMQSPIYSLTVGGTVPTCASRKAHK
jgi:hypothetical protein